MTPSPQMMVPTEDERGREQHQRRHQPTDEALSEVDVFKSVRVPMLPPTWEKRSMTCSGLWPTRDRSTSLATRQP
jgi:hypothetical protein